MDHLMMDENSTSTCLDLYDDLITTERLDLQESHNALSEDCMLKQTRIEELEKEVSRLTESESSLTERCQVLERNISKLFVTARLELQRKDREINSLRNQLKHPRKFQRTSKNKDQSKTESTSTSSTKRKILENHSVDVLAKRRKLTDNDSPRSKENSNHRKSEQDSRRSRRESCEERESRRSSSVKRTVFRATSVARDSVKETEKSRAKKLLERSKKDMRRRSSGTKLSEDTEKSTLNDASQNSHSSSKMLDLREKLKKKTQDHRVNSADTHVKLASNGGERKSGRLEFNSSETHVKLTSNRGESKSDRDKVNSADTHVKLPSNGSECKSGRQEVNNSGTHVKLASNGSEFKSDRLEVHELPENSKLETLSVMKTECSVKSQNKFIDFTDAKKNVSCIAYLPKPITNEYTKEGSFVDKSHTYESSSHKNNFESDISCNKSVETRELSAKSLPDRKGEPQEKCRMKAKTLNGVEGKVGNDLSNSPCHKKNTKDSEMGKRLRTPNRMDKERTTRSEEDKLKSDTAKYERRPTKASRSRSPSEGKEVKLKRSRSPCESKRNKTKSRSPCDRKKGNDTKHRSPDVKRERNGTKSRSPCEKRERNGTKSRSPCERRERNGTKSRSPCERRERNGTKSRSPCEKRERNGTKSRSPCERRERNGTKSRSPCERKASEIKERNPTHSKTSGERHHIDKIDIKYQTPSEKKEKVETKSRSPCENRSREKQIKSRSISPCVRKNPELRKRSRSKSPSYRKNSDRLRPKSRSPCQRKSHEMAKVDRKSTRNRSPCEIKSKDYKKTERLHQKSRSPSERHIKTSKDNFKSKSASSELKSKCSQRERHPESLNSEDSCKKRKDSKTSDSKSHGLKTPDIKFVQSTRSDSKRRRSVDRNFKERKSASERKRGETDRERKKKMKDICMSHNKRSERKLSTGSSRRRLQCDEKNKRKKESTKSGDEYSLKKLPDRNSHSDEDEEWLTEPEVWFGEEDSNDTGGDSEDYSSDADDTLVEDMQDNIIASKTKINSDSNAMVSSTDNGSPGKSNTLPTTNGIDHLHIDEQVEIFNSDGSDINDTLSDGESVKNGDPDSEDDLYDMNFITNNPEISSHNKEKSKDCSASSELSNKDSENRIGSQLDNKCKEKSLENSKQNTPCDDKSDTAGQQDDGLPAQTGHLMSHEEHGDCGEGSAVCQLRGKTAVNHTTESEESPVVCSHSNKSQHYSKVMHTRSPEKYADRTGYENSLCVEKAKKYDSVCSNDELTAVHEAKDETFGMDEGNTYIDSKECEESGGIATNMAENINTSDLEELNNLKTILEQQLSGDSSQTNGCHSDDIKLVADHDNNVNEREKVSSESQIENDCQNNHISDSDFENSGDVEDGEIVSDSDDDDDDDKVVETVEKQKIINTHKTQQSSCDRKENRSADIPSVDMKKLKERRDRFSGKGSDKCIRSTLVVLKDKTKDKLVGELSNMCNNRVSPERKEKSRKDKAKDVRTKDVSKLRDRSPSRNDKNLHLSKHDIKDQNRHPENQGRKTSGSIEKSRECHHAGERHQRSKESAIDRRRVEGHHKTTKIRKH